MPISNEHIEHIAYLARIELRSGEVEKFRGELGDILAYVDKLQSVDIEGVDPLRTISGACGVMRDDNHIEDPDRRPEGRNLIDQAPEVKSGYVKTKGVFDNDTSF